MDGNGKKGSSEDALKDLIAASVKNLDRDLKSEAGRNALNDLISSSGANLEEDLKKTAVRNALSKFNEAAENMKAQDVFMSVVDPMLRVNQVDEKFLSLVNAINDAPSKAMPSFLQELAQESAKFLQVLACFNEKIFNRYMNALQIQVVLQPGEHQALASASLLLNNEDQYKVALASVKQELVMLQERDVEDVRQKNTSKAFFRSSLESIPEEFNPEVRAGAANKIQEWFRGKLANKNKGQKPHQGLSDIHQEIKSFNESVKRENFDGFVEAIVNGPLLEGIQDTRTESFFALVTAFNKMNENASDSKEFVEEIGKDSIFLKVLAYCDEAVLGNQGAVSLNPEQLESIKQAVNALKGNQYYQNFVNNVKFEMGSDSNKGNEWLALLRRILSDASKPAEDKSLKGKSGMVEGIFNRLRFPSSRADDKLLQDKNRAKKSLFTNTRDQSSNNQSGKSRI